VLLGDEAVPQRAAAAGAATGRLHATLPATGRLLGGVGLAREQVVALAAEHPEARGRVGGELVELEVREEARKPAHVPRCVVRVARSRDERDVHAAAEQQRDVARELVRVRVRVKVRVRVRVRVRVS